MKIIVTINCLFFILSFNLKMDAKSWDISEFSPIDPLNLSGGAEDFGEELDKAIKKLDESMVKAVESLDKTSKEFNSDLHKNMLNVTSQFNSDFSKTSKEFVDKLSQEGQGCSKI